MEGKKISFGFMKTKKVDKPMVEEKREYIECIDEKAIKVVGGEEIEEEKPLIIPMKPNTLITAERLKEIAEKVEKEVDTTTKEETVKEEIIIPENETLEQMAVRELMQEAKKEKKSEGPAMTVPVASKPVTDGKESSLDDYESVPVQNFGMAMLRGMGWNENMDQSKYKLPELRPKGLGLGADKVIKENQKKNSASNKEEELAIVKNAFVRITTGKYSGYYGKVVSLDEDNGRVMVDIPIKKETVSLSEFMMHAVSRTEYDKESKVINADSYEQYKREEKSQKSRHESPKVNDKGASSSQNYDKREKDGKRERDHKREKDSSNGKSRDRKDSSSSDDRHKRNRKRYSSNDSVSTSDDERRKKQKSKKKNHSSSDSEDYRREKKHKRDIDKKRKGKKKKRDRDRSPNYKKHRK